MKIIAVLICFIVIAFNFASITNSESLAYYGINNSVLFHLTSFLLLTFIGYTIFFKHQRAVMYNQSEKQKLFNVIQSLFKDMPGAIMTLERDFTIIDINPTISKVTGLKADSIRGKKCYDILANGKICNNCVVQKALVSGKTESGAKTESKKVDGKSIFGKHTAIPIKDQDGHIEYIYEIVIDITQEVTLERENSEMLIDVVGAMVNLIESRDLATGTHSFKVQSLALSIGEKMGLIDKELKELSIAGILHDIGKIGIAEAILNKPGRLTDLELSEIRHHPQIGYNAIKHIKRLQKVSEAILDHHEQYNGGGYPSGKKKEEISIIARIISVADVFEALTSDRVYRKAMSIQQAIDIIQEGKGRQFDPNVVNALLEILHEEKSMMNVSTRIQDETDIVMGTGNLKTC